MTSPELTEAVARLAASVTPRQRRRIEEDPNGGLIVDNRLLAALLTAAEAVGCGYCGRPLGEPVENPGAAAYHDYCAGIVYGEQEFHSREPALPEAIRRFRVAAELTVQDVRAQRGDHIAGLVEDSFAAHFARADR